MEATSRGTLFSVIFLILGTALLPEPSDALPPEYHVRYKRVAAQDARCPTCPREYPENLTDGRIYSQPQQEYRPMFTKRSYPTAPAQTYKSVPTNYDSSSSVTYQQVAPTSYDSSSSVTYQQVAPKSYDSSSSVTYQQVAPKSYDSSSSVVYQPVARKSYDSSASVAYQPVASNSYDSSYSVAYEPEASKSYDSSPSVTYEQVASSSYDSSTPEDYESAYDAPTVTYYVDPPPASKKPYYRKRPSYRASAPDRYDLMSRHTRPSKSRYAKRPSKFRNSNYSPYTVDDYQPQYDDEENEYNYEYTDRYPSANVETYEDDNDRTVSSKYNRKPSDGDYYRVYRHYNPDSASSMYSNYRPYEREEKEPQEVAINENPSRNRERLYVVYRADILDDEIKPTKLSPSLEAPALPDHELESVVRKAVEITRQQRAQESALFGRSGKQYRYIHIPDNPSEPVPTDENYEQTESKTLDNESRFNVPPAQIMESEDKYVVKEAGDEANNPGSDQSKWVPVPPTPYTNLEEAAEKVVELGEETTAKPALDGEKVGEKISETEVIKRDVESEAKAPEDLKTDEKNVDLIQEIELPQPFTEPTSFYAPTETTTTEAKT